MLYHQKKRRCHFELHSAFTGTLLHSKEALETKVSKAPSPCFCLTFQRLLCWKRGWNSLILLLLFLVHLLFYGNTSCYPLCLWVAWPFWLCAIAFFWINNLIFDDAFFFLFSLSLYHSYCYNGRNLCPHVSKPYIWWLHKSIVLTMPFY